MNRKWLAGSAVLVLLLLNGCYEQEEIEGTAFKDWKIRLEDRSIFYGKSGIQEKEKEFPVDGTFSCFTIDDDLLVAVTDAGEIVRTEDCEKWEIHEIPEDFGEIEIGGLTFGGGCFYLYGQMGAYPILLYSVDGASWNRRPLDMEQGQGVTAEYVIHNAVWDGAELLLVIDDGVVMVPNCVECNSTIPIPGIIPESVTAEGEILSYVTESGERKTLDLLKVKNNSISQVEAEKMLAEGAVLIDVRSEDEFAEGHAEGAVSIPLDQLAERLEEEYTKKDTVLIFYCSYGVRSGQAADQAVGMGYASAVSAGAWKND